jgi:adenosylhomocysteine nucleosidase
LPAILLVASEWFEMEHIHPRPGWKLVKVANGPGRRLAGEGVARITEPVDVVVSTGLCGALDPILGIGDVFAASEVNGLAAELPRSRRAYRSGRLVSMDRVVQTVDEKRRLRADTGAMAVEMEAAAVREYASRRGVPFYCIRAVSDVADEGFVVDLNAARNASGRFSIPRVLLQAARRPAELVPELLRLRRNAGVATRALGDFFADCDF